MSKKVDYTSKDGLLTIFRNIKSLFDKNKIQYSYNNGRLTINGGFSGGGSSMHEYSTEEKVVGKWIDGKPIYEIVISGIMVGLPTNWTNFYDCANLSIDNMISIKGFFNYDNERSFGIDSKYTAFTYVYNTKFIQYYNTDLARHNFETTLIIQYTKTTD